MKKGSKKRNRNFFELFVFAAASRLFFEDFFVVASFPFFSCCSLFALSLPMFADFMTLTAKK